MISLKIGPIIYSVKLVDEGDFEHLKSDSNEMFSGESRPDECTMLINNKHHPQQQFVALFHEILHVLLLQGGKQFESEDESLIAVLAYGILQTLIDNQWLHEGLKTQIGITTAAPDPPSAASSTVDSEKSAGG